MLESARSLRGRLDIAMVRDKVAAGIDMVRRRLDSTGEILRHYHCTFVACVLTDRGGYVCQIGDSIAVGTCFVEGGALPPAVVDFFPEDRTRVFYFEAASTRTRPFHPRRRCEHLRVIRLAASGADALLT